MNNHSSVPEVQDTSSTSALIVGSVALFTDMLVVGLAVPVLPLLPSVLDAGPAATGILFASYAIAMVLATFVAGRTVDRYGPKTPLLIGLIGLAIATLLFAMGGPYFLLFVARFAQGVAGGMSWVASLSLIAATTPMEKRGQAMGIALSTITLGVLIGPIVAGFMVEHFNTSAPFLLAAGVAFADGLLRIILVKGTPRVTDDTGGPLSVLRVSGSTSIATTILVGAAVLASLEPVLPVHLNTSALNIGLLFALASLAGIVANPAVGYYVGKVSSRLLTASGLLFITIALFIVGFANELWQTSVGMIFLGLSSAFLLAPATTLIADQGYKAKPSTLGGSFALYNLAYASGLAIGPLLTGLGVQQLGFSMALVVAAVVLALLGGFSLSRLPSGVAANS
ncbi:MFS transporter [Actinomyces lilanjuaniae]|uniref:MFS transporter n=1 Tax=Actinomyces lilanjuaniae TaxID=2321394 RepID=A0ABN5PRY2_9ACTO|nr:MFS transporter [Actinomyces lilanjuaniae]AYD89867.1 MFS transporter [Actinomyces lilanjuaniae]